MSRNLCELRNMGNFISYYWEYAFHISSNKKLMLITTNEEFLASRRAKEFQGDYSPEENDWWNSQSQKQAAIGSCAYTRSIRQGFPPDLALARILHGSNRIDDSKDRNL